MPWRSFFVVASLCTWLGVAKSAPSVAVDVSRLDSADAGEIEQAVVMRLLQEGFAIDPTTAPAIVVVVTGDDRELVLSAKSAYFERSRTIEISDASRAQRQLELVQKVAELARLAREAAPPAHEPVKEATLRRAVVVERPPRWRLGADVGVDSSGTIEGALHARFAIGESVGATLRAAAAQPNTRDIFVDEQELLAGASYEWPLARALALDASLLAGVRRHHFELAIPLTEMSGTRFDPAIAVPLRLALRLARAFEVSVWGIAELSAKRDHVNETTVLWHRDAFTAGGGAGVAARF